MSIQSRKHTQQVLVGNVKVSGGAPSVVQSMSNTDTADVTASVHQIIELSNAGSEIVRVTVGKGKARDPQFQQMIKLACRYDKPVRIGVNGGSLDPLVLTRLLDENRQLANPSNLRAVTREAIIQSALESATKAQELGLAKNKITLSCKISNVQELINIYEDLSSRCDYALHLVLTEAGTGSKGMVASAAALGVLMQQGIGDAIHVSLTPESGGSRTQEVRVAQEILQTMGFRSFTPMVIACPGCGRTTSDYFQRLAQDIQRFLREQMPVWKDKYKGVKTVTLKGEHIAEEFQALVERYIESHYQITGIIHE